MTVKARKMMFAQGVATTNHCAIVNLLRVKETININNLGGTVFGTNRNHPWDKQDQTSRFLLNSTGKSPFCPVCPWDRLGCVPGTIVPQGPSDFFCMHFVFVGFLRPPDTFDHDKGQKCAISDGRLHWIF